MRSVPPGGAADCVDLLPQELTGTTLNAGMNTFEYQYDCSYFYLCSDVRQIVLTRSAYKCGCLFVYLAVYKTLVLMVCTAGSDRGTLGNQMFPWKRGQYRHSLGTFGQPSKLSTSYENIQFLNAYLFSLQFNIQPLLLNSFFGKALKSYYNIRINIPSGYDLLSLTYGYLIFYWFLSHRIN